MNRDQINGLWHSGGIIIHPGSVEPYAADAWIYLKPCRAAGTSIFKHGLRGVHMPATDSLSSDTMRALSVLVANDMRILGYI